MNLYSPAFIRAALLLVPSLLVAVLFYPVLAFEAVWDDFEWIDMIRDHRKSTEEWFWHVLTQPSIITSRYYRPLASFTFFAQQGELQVANWHAFSYFLAIANSLLFSWLCLSNLQPDRPSVPWPARLLCLGLVTAACIHPVQTELVGWVSARFDLMALFFLLLTTIALQLRIGMTTKAILTGLFYLLALCSKESAITYLALLPFVIYFPCWYHSQQTSFRQLQISHWAVYAAFTLSTLIYFVLRANAVSIVPNDLPSSSGNNLLMAVETYGHFMRLLLTPFFDMSPSHHFAGHQPMYIVAGAFLFCACLALWRYHKPACILLALFILLLIPYSNILVISTRGDIVQNRYLAIPVYFLAYAIAALLLKHPHAPVKPGIIAIGLWLALASTTVHNLLPNWQTPLALWQWAAKENQDAYHPQLDYAEAVYLSGDIVGSADLFAKADSLSPACTTKAWLGITHARLMQPEVANRYFDEAFKGGCEEKLFTRASIFYIQLNLHFGHFERAEAALKQYQASGVTNPVLERLLFTLQQARKTPPTNNP